MAAYTDSAAVCGVALGASYDQKMPWFGTVRGRLGYASGSWLAYVTGGYAYARLETTASATAGALTESISSDDTRSGWTVGGGFEWGFAPNWSVKAEYLYYDLGDTTVTATSALAPGAITTSFDNEGHIARIGLNYRFGWGGGAPVVARY